LPSLQRILGLVSSTFLALGLAHGGQGERTASSGGVTLAPVEARSQAPVPQSPVAQSLNNLPWRFEANQGQSDQRVDFISRGQGYTLFLAGEEAVLSLQKPSAVGAQPSADGSQILEIRNSKLETGISKSDARHSDSVVRMKLAGAQAAKAVGLDPLPTKTDYFLGSDPAKWRRNVPNYGKVKYSNVYPGIDLVYYGNQRQLEYDFVVAPGANPKDIRFALETDDAKKQPARIDASGDLVIALGDASEARFRKPSVYQMIDGQRRAIDARYALGEIANPKSKIVNPEFEVSFELAAYNPHHAL